MSSKDSLAPSRPCNLSMTGSKWRFLSWSRSSLHDSFVLASFSHCHESNLSSMNSWCEFWIKRLRFANFCGLGCFVKRRMGYIKCPWRHQKIEICPVYQNLTSAIICTCYSCDLFGARLIQYCAFKEIQARGQPFWVKSQISWIATHNIEL